SQNQPSSAVRPWQKSRTSGVKGTHIQTPTSILKELKMNPDECPDLSPGAPTKMDAYRVQRNARTIAPVHGGGFCFCGATGNCAFWIYRFHQGKYTKILETDMARTFGFLSSRTNVLPDL